MNIKYITKTTSISVVILSLMFCNLIKSQNKMNTEIPKISDFPTGEENKGYAQYFTGKSWLAPLTENHELNVPVSNVTFEPGSRNNWHSHTGGQLLIVVGGEGLYQEREKPARHLKAGDIVEIAPNVEHWHGATAESWFSHLATNGNPKTNENKWLEPVTDEVYQEANHQIKK